MDLPQERLLPHITFKTSRSGGPGGQNVNKVSSKVELRFDFIRSDALSDDQKKLISKKLQKHITADGHIQVFSQESRSQLQNKENALRLLKSQLYEIEMRKKMEATAAVEGNKKKIEWGSQIRNYVLHPYKLVKDLRTNYETSNTQAVLDGDINDFLKAYLMEFSD